MSAVMKQDMPLEGAWQEVCGIDDILPNMGVAALLGRRQIALFRVVAGDNDPGSIYAIDNYDANSDANVLSRGIVGDVQGELVVASPIYKHHFSLKTGRCLENEAASVHSYPVRIEEGRVQLSVPIPAKAPAKAAKQKPRLVVIGNGMAGMRTVEELLQLAPEMYDITVFGAEPHGNYNRILLSPLLAGEKKLDDIMLHTREWYAEQGITLHAGDPVIGVHRAKRVVRSLGGLEVPYDRVLLATGSRPFVIPVPGKDLPGVISFRDIQDVDTMLEAARQHKKAVVIGGGLLGLEAANGLMRQGMDVTVVHLLDSLMERQLDKPAAALLKASLEQRGLTFLMEAQTAEIVSGVVAGTVSNEEEPRVVGVRFNDGKQIQADLVVMAVGITPNIELAQKLGLRCDRGVLVNDTLQTFDPRIYAVGECVQHRNATYGLVAPLWDQARVCATHLAQLGHSRYSGSITATKLKVTGIDLFSAGDFVGGEDSEDLVYKDSRRGVYKRLVVKDGKLIGAVLYGDVKDGNWYFELIKKGTAIGAVRDRLVFGQSFVGEIE
ncbi:MAG: nitrite reductase small subunit NirD [Nevskiales bacterium]